VWGRYEEISGCRVRAGYIGSSGTAPTLFSSHFRDNGSIARVGLNYRFY
jgi:hypothetical protein